MEAILPFMTENGSGNLNLKSIKQEKESESCVVLNDGEKKEGRCKVIKREIKLNTGSCGVVTMPAPNGRRPGVPSPGTLTLKGDTILSFICRGNGICYKPDDAVFVENCQQDLPYYIGVIKEIKVNKRDTLVATVKWFYRLSEVPDIVQQSLVQDRNHENGSRLDLNIEDPVLRSRELFVSDVTDTYPVSALRGKCHVKHYPDITEVKGFVPQKDNFFYVLGYNPETKRLATTQGEIRVGSTYQARLPEYKHVSPSEMLEKCETREEPRWQPQCVVDGDLVMFLRAARSVAAFAGMCDGGSTDDGCQAASMDETTINAMHTLHDHKYDTGKALQALVKCPVPKAIEKKWTEEETKRFVRGLRQFGKNFFRIRKEHLPHRETGELVEYYYFWKKTPAAASNRPHRRHRRQTLKRQNTRSSRPASSDFLDLTSASELSEDSDDSDSRSLSSAYSCGHCCTTNSKDWHHAGKDKSLLCTDCRLYFKKYGEERPLDRSEESSDYLFRPVKDEDSGNGKQNMRTRQTRNSSGNIKGKKKESQSISPELVDSPVCKSGPKSPSVDSICSDTSSVKIEKEEISNKGKKRQHNSSDTEDKLQKRKKSEEDNTDSEFVSEDSSSVSANDIDNENDEIGNEGDIENNQDDLSSSTPRSTPSPTEDEFKSTTQPCDNTPPASPAPHPALAESPPNLSSTPVSQESTSTPLPPSYPPHLALPYPFVPPPLHSVLSQLRHPHHSLLPLQIPPERGVSPVIPKDIEVQKDIDISSNALAPDEPKQLEQPHPVPPEPPFSPIISVEQTVKIKEEPLSPVQSHLVPPSAEIDRDLHVNPLQKLSDLADIRDLDERDIKCPVLPSVPPCKDNQPTDSTIIKQEPVDEHLYEKPIEASALGPSDNQESAIDNSSSVVVPLKVELETDSQIEKDTESVMSDSESERGRTPSPGPDPIPCNKEIHKSTSAIFIKLLNRGTNSCSRCDLIFKPLPDSKLCKKREDREKKAVTPSTPASSSSSHHRPSSTPKEEKRRLETPPPNSSADAQIISNVSTHTPYADRHTPRPYADTPALRQLSEYARPHVIASQDVPRSLPYSLSSLPPYIDPVLSHRMAALYPPGSRERLEFELERDKRERDARERELRERELRDLELREKLKQEMEMKPPGFERLGHPGANSLDPHWLELQRRCGYPPGPLVANGSGPPSCISSSHMPGVYPPASLANDLMSRERERLERLGIPTPLPHMSGDASYPSAVERLSAERIQAERMALSGDPMIRMQMMGLGQSAAHTHTHAHAHSHTHLHLHQQQEALLQQLHGFPPPPHLMTPIVPGADPLSGGGQGSGSSALPAPGGSGAGHPLSSLPHGLPPHALLSGREQQDIALQRELYSRAYADPAFAHQLSAQAAAAHHEALQRLALERERLGSSGHSLPH